MLLESLSEVLTTNNEYIILHIMSKRMQVLMDEEEFEELRSIARAKGMSLAAWVRGTLRRASSQVPLREKKKKIAIVRAASKHEFPAPDIEQMLAEIESGYLFELPK